MISTAKQQELKAKTFEYLDNAGIVLTNSEKQEIEIAEFGLGRVEEIGLQLVVYVNTDRCCAKELVLLPGQICPEHLHPPVDGQPGKEETFRCRWGTVYLYVPGEPVAEASATVPMDKRDTFTVWHEIILNPGEQYTLAPNTLHWFAGGPEGAVVSEFSTKSRDDLDVFTDREIQRMPD